MSPSPLNRVTDLACTGSEAVMTWFLPIAFSLLWEKGHETYRITQRHLLALEEEFTNV